MGISRVSLNLFTDAPNMHGHRLTIADLAPKTLEELLSRKNLTGMYCEEAEKRKLSGGERKWLTLDEDLMRHWINDQTSKVKHAGGWLFFLTTTENSLHAGHDLTGRGGFRDIIVSSQSEAAQFLFVAIVRTQKENREIACFTDVPA